MRRAAIAILCASLALAGCGGDDDAGPARSSAAGATVTPTTATSTTSTIPDAAPPQPAVPVGEIALTLTEVARLSQPLALAVREGTDGFYVAEKGGRVQHIASPGAEARQVLDVSGEVSSGNEQGLLGLTFSPDGSTMYISYTNRDGDTRVEEVDPETGDRGDLFATDQPYANHNGGNVIFGPDGLLWLGLGDGGAAGDPEDRAQDPEEVLGKLLRFDPADPEPQIYAHGLRNPWRFTFDRETEDLWIGDVGQNAWEEIDRLPAGTPPGADFGWPQAEGTHGYKASGPPADSILPVYEYGRDVGQSVVGGYVYRGDAIADLAGTYLFVDTYTAELQALSPDGDAYVHTDLGIDVPGGLVSSFGEDAGGELYVMSLEGGVYRIDPS